MWCLDRYYVGLDQVRLGETQVRLGRVRLISLSVCQYLARRELCRLLWRDGKGLDWVKSSRAARYNSDQVQQRKWIWASYFCQTLMAIFITSLVIFDERELKSASALAEFGGL